MSTPDTFSGCVYTADCCCESTPDTFSGCVYTADCCCESTADTFPVVCCMSTVLLYHDVILASTMNCSIALFFM